MIPTTIMKRKIIPIIISDSRVSLSTCALERVSRSFKNCSFSNNAVSIKDAFGGAIFINSINKITFENYNWTTKIKFNENDESQNHREAVKLS